MLFGIGRDGGIINNINNGSVLDKTALPAVIARC
jgi:hypothetical protein